MALPSNDSFVDMTPFTNLKMLLSIYLKAAIPGLNEPHSSNPHRQSAYFTNHCLRRSISLPNTKSLTFLRFKNQFKMQELTAIAPSTPVTTSTEEQEPTPVAPSTEEQCFYFDGLPSNPKLVARSSSLDIKWERGNGGTVWGSKKCLYPASPTHPIASLWGGTLRREIINALDGSGGSGGLDWTAIDIVRIGLDPSLDRPDEVPEKHHVLLVSVASNSTTWDQGYPVAIRCRIILQQYGIHDVHCEIKESDIARS